MGYSHTCTSVNSEKNIQLKVIAEKSKSGPNLCLQNCKLNGKVRPIEIPVWSQNLVLDTYISIAWGTCQRNVVWYLVAFLIKTWMEFCEKCFIRHLHWCKSGENYKWNWSLKYFERPCWDGLLPLVTCGPLCPTTWKIPLWTYIIASATALPRRWLLFFLAWKTVFPGWSVSWEKPC